MRLGFTGSRLEPSAAQMTWALGVVLDSKGIKAHHGCCVGGDAGFHRICKQSSDLTVKSIDLHPPVNPRFEMEYTDWDYVNCTWWPKKDYNIRNHDIVDATDYLIAFAKEGTDINTMGSGTWSTIRYAVSRNKHIRVCYPDGHIVRLGSAL